MSQDPTPTVPTAPPAPSGYEFSADENRLLLDLAGKMRFVGIFFLVVGAVGVALMILLWIKGNFAIDIASLVLIFLGIWTIGAARSFETVALTQGNDIPNLLKALTDLRSMYALLYAVLLAGLILTLLLFVFVTVAR